MDVASAELKKLLDRFRRAARRIAEEELERARHNVYRSQRELPDVDDDHFDRDELGFDPEEDEDF